MLAYLVRLDQALNMVSLQCGWFPDAAGVQRSWGSPIESSECLRCGLELQAPAVRTLKRTLARMIFSHTIARFVSCLPSIPSAQTGTHQ